METSLPSTRHLNYGYSPLSFSSAHVSGSRFWSDGRFFEAIVLSRVNVSNVLRLEPCEPRLRWHSPVTGLGRKKKQTKHFCWYNSIYIIIIIKSFIAFHTDLDYYRQPTRKQQKNKTLLHISFLASSSTFALVYY